MRTLEANMIRPGVRLPMGLYTRQGVKLLNAGVTLTEAMCHALLHSKWGDLFLARSAGDLRDGNLLFEARQEPAGRTASADLVTAGGVLAVEAGQTVELHHAEAYDFGAFQGLETREDQRLRAARMKLADQYVQELSSRWERLPRTIGPSPLATEPPSGAPRPWPEGAALGDFRGERVRRVRRILARVLSGVRASAGEAMSLIDELADLQRLHPARYTQLGLLARHAADGLPDHCYTTACLSVAIAARLGWSPAHARLAGLAGLLADVGMGLVPQGLRTSERALNEVEVNRVRRHPAFGVVLLESIGGLPEEVRLAAYQHHERENGSGYPCGIKSAKITDLARVVSVADAFAAATSFRRHRPTKRPYDAVEEMIMLGSSRVFERRVVRALVESTGLFPVGSHVQLSNESPALVIGSSGEQIDRPIVRVLLRGPGGYTPGMTLDLTEFKPWDLSVIQAIDPLAAPAASSPGAQGPGARRGA